MPGTAIQTPSTSCLLPWPKPSGGGAWLAVVAVLLGWALLAALLTVASPLFGLIVLGAVFVAWCVSGVVLMYYGVPHLTAAERLVRLPPLDLSTLAKVRRLVARPRLCVSRRCFSRASISARESW